MSTNKTIIKERSIFLVRNKKFIYYDSLITNTKEGTLLVTYTSKDTHSITKTMVLERFKNSFFSYDISLRRLFDVYTNCTNFKNHIYILT